MEVNVYCGPGPEPMFAEDEDFEPGRLLWKIVQCCGALDPGLRYEKVAVGSCAKCGMIFRLIAVRI